MKYLIPILVAVVCLLSCTPSGPRVSGPPKVREEVLRDGKWVEVPPDPPAASEGPTTYHWKRSRLFLRSLFLYRGRVIVGQYDTSTSKYWGKNPQTGRWEITTPPIPVPEAFHYVPDPEKPKKDPEGTNYGLDWSKVGNDGETYRVNGLEVSSREAKKVLVQGGTLPDDSKRLRVTIIGPQPARQQVLSDLQSPAGLQWKDHIVVQDYDPIHWAVARAGFVTGGNPTVYVQAPDGKVLHRQDLYQPGDLFTALRRADPLYNPSTDPDLKKTPVTPSSPSSVSGIWTTLKGLLKDIPVVLIVLGGILMFLILQERKT